MVMTLALFSLSSNAEVTKSDMDYMKQQQKQLQEFKSQVSGFQYGLPESQVERLSKDEKEINSSIKNTTPGQDGPKLLYFVSFSIPDSGIVNMDSEAKKYGFLPVVRGLINNDFKATAEKVFTLTKRNKDFGVAIDPFLFKEYNIRAVPALVMVCGDKHDLVYGSLPVKESLEKISLSGDCKDEAKKILDGE